MSDKDEAARLAEEQARQQREADLVKSRIEELHEEPVRGNFDAEHLKAVHAHIFQDFPDHQPGAVREDTGGWIKTRVLEGTSDNYVVHYEKRDIEAKITSILDQFGGAESLKGLTPEAAAGRLAELYGDLDHAHGFYEGNSRTLREFTRELAEEAGFNLDWTGASVSEAQRNKLYMARDLAVMERAFPDLTPAKAMQTNDRLEFEASFVIEALRNDVGDRTLEAIIRDGLSPDIQLKMEHGQGQLQEATPMGRTPEGVEIAEGAAEALDAVANVAGDAIEGIATSLEGLLGGGTSAPAPQQTEQAETQKPQSVEEFLAMERQQSESARQERASQLGESRTLSPEELQREEMEAQQRGRDGGISR